MANLSLDEHVTFHSAPIFAADPLRPMSHCATLAELPEGDLVAAWYAGAYETAPDQAILSARLPVHESHWTPPVILVDTPLHADGQPVLYVHSVKSLWLFFVTIEERDWTSARLRLQTSLDGVRWSAPRTLFDRLGLMFRSKPVNLPNGDILVPIYDEAQWQSMSMLSADGGNTWQLGQPIVTPAGNIHPSVALLSDGRLLAYLRPGGEGEHIWQAVSTDHGRTWGHPTRTHFPNPNSGIDLIRLRNGHLVLAFNDSPLYRTPLRIALSQDEGRTWTSVRTLEDGDGEFSYPALLQTRDGLVHCVYTCRRETIQHALFSEQWLMAEN